MVFFSECGKGDNTTIKPLSPWALPLLHMHAQFLGVGE